MATIALASSTSPEVPRGDLAVRALARPAPAPRRPSSSRAGPSLVALNSSRGWGRRSPRRSSPSPSRTATLTHHCGIPNRKLMVPSSGSTTQLSPLEPGSLLPSSPTKPSSGRRSRSSSRIARSEARSASLTRSVGVLLDLTSASRPWRPAPAAARRRCGRPPARARPARTGRSREAGRALLLPRALGLELGRERQQRRLVPFAPHQLHRPRQPVGPESRPARPPPADR